MAVESRAKRMSLSGVWEHAPPENFEVHELGNAICSIFQKVFPSKRATENTTIIIVTFNKNLVLSMELIM